MDNSTGLTEQENQLIHHVFTTLFGDRLLLTSTYLAEAVTSTPDLQRWFGMVVGKGDQTPDLKPLPREKFYLKNIIRVLKICSSRCVNPVIFEIFKRAKYAIECSSDVLLDIKILESDFLSISDIVIS